MVCEMCGDIRHKTEDCNVKATIVCPKCGSGTYIHASGLRCCVNAFCDWIGDD